MTTLIFDFDEKTIFEEGLTKDELLKDIRFFASKHDIYEHPVGEFWKEGDSVALLVGYAVTYSRKHPEYLNYLKSWIVEYDDVTVDCKHEMQNIMRKCHG